MIKVKDIFFASSGVVKKLNALSRDYILFIILMLIRETMFCLSLIIKKSLTILRVENIYL
jgi:hypothetical protein